MQTKSLFFIIRFDLSMAFLQFPLPLHPLHFVLLSIRLCRGMVIHAIFLVLPQHLFKSLDRYLQRIDTISLKENDSSAWFFPVTITKPSFHDCIRRAFFFYFPTLDFFLYFECSEYFTPPTKYTQANIVKA